MGKINLSFFKEKANLINEKTTDLTSLEVATLADDQLEFYSRAELDCDTITFVAKDALPAIGEAHGELLKAAIESRRAIHELIGEAF